MSDGVAYADIIILALIAGFILLRLRSVLGHKIGNDNPDFLRRNMREEAEREPVVKMSEKILRPRPAEEEQDQYLDSVTDTSLLDTLKAVKAKDPEFSASHFLQGAKMAFEMVFEGFAKADKAPLKMLLSDELYKQFESEIEARETSDRKTETTLVSVEAKDITRAEMYGNTTRLTVRFASEQISVVRDKDGKIVEGDPSEVNEAIDEWTFERDLTSRNPNWKIIDT